MNDKVTKRVHYEHILVCGKCFDRLYDQVECDGCNYLYMTIVQPKIVSFATHKKIVSCGKVEGVQRPEYITTYRPMNEFSRWWLVVYLKNFEPLS